jgi:hypothetical protein
MGNIATTLIWVESMGERFCSPYGAPQGAFTPAF